MERHEPDLETSGKMLTTIQVAELLGVHANTVRKWANQGILQAIRLGPRGDRRFPQEDVIRLLGKMDE